jgi:hypothetical protein
MDVDSLCDIIRKHGKKYNNKFNNAWIKGRDLLEHIEDVEGFVSLLGKFTRFNCSFVDDYPNPIEFILNRTIEFRIYGLSVGILNIDVRQHYTYTFGG